MLHVYLCREIVAKILEKNFEASQLPYFSYPNYLVKKSYFPLSQSLLRLVEMLLVYSEI